MAFLDKLSTIFKVDLSGLKKLNLINISINSNNNSPKIEVRAEKLLLNLTQFSLAENKALKKAIKSYFSDEGILLENEAEQTVEDFQISELARETRGLLEFFKGKIPALDLEILRASLYLKKVHESGRSVNNLKVDIMRRYGDRGRNISNLCTAGYFKSQIKPLYEDMYSQPDFSPEKFISVYEIIVTQSPYAEFINSHMSDTEVLDVVSRKMEFGRKYGIRYLNIHGIGIDNVQKINRLMVSLDQKFTKPPEVNSTQGFIVIKIYF